MDILGAIRLPTAAASARRDLEEPRCGRSSTRACYTTIAQDRDPSPPMVTVAEESSGIQSRDHATVHASEDDEFVLRCPGGHDLPSDDEPFMETTVRTHCDRRDCWPVALMTGAMPCTRILKVGATVAR